MRTIAASLVVTALLAVAPVPAAAQSREHQQMAAELRMLQERSQETALALDKALAQLRELSQITDTIKLLSTRLEAMDDALRKSQADQKGQLDAVNRELRTIGERTQTTNVRIGELSEEVDALGTSLSQMIATSAALPQPTEPFATTSADTPTPVSLPASPRSGLSPTRLYDTAWADYTSGNLTLAISGFQQFLREYPKYDKADDAQFYIAESLMKLKRTPEAISAYSLVIQSYGGGDYTPEAYYRLGEAQRSLGQIEAARESWQTVVKKYPESNGGILAKQRLDGLPPPAVPRLP